MDMPRTEIMRLGMLFSLIPEEQKMQILFESMMVEGTQESVSFVTSKEINDMTVESVEAEGGCLKVWLKDYENA